MLPNEVVTVLLKGKQPAVPAASELMVMCWMEEEGDPRLDG